MSGGRGWSPAEDSELRRMFAAGEGDAAVAAALGRTEHAVRDRRHALGATSRSNATTSMPVIVRHAERRSREVYGWPGP